MATKAQRETSKVAAGRTKRLRNGVPSRANVPPAAGKGRAPGTLNRFTVKAKESLEDAFALMGGTAGLVEWGEKNPTEFYRLWARLIPKDVSVSASSSLEELLERLGNGAAEQPGDSAIVVSGSYRTLDNEDA